MTTVWQQFSQDISNAVEVAGKSIVAVDGRAGHTSSGIVWRRDTILTAAHAIRHETKIGVILGPGRAVTGRLAGRDRGTDIAVVKLDAEIEMPPAEFGSTASMSVGEFTVAVARTRRGNHRRQRRNHQRSDGGMAGRTDADRPVHPSGSDVVSWFFRRSARERCRKRTGFEHQRFASRQTYHDSIVDTDAEPATKLPQAGT